MICPHCGKEIPDGTHYCLYCMKSLQEEKVYSPAVVKKKNKRIWMIALAAIVVLGASAAAYLAVQDKPVAEVTADAGESSAEESAVSSSSAEQKSSGEYEQTETGGKIFVPAEKEEVSGLDGEVNFDVQDGVLTGYSGTSAVIEIPEDVTVIGESVFWNDSNITKVILPEGLTEIKTSAFAGCTNLTSIEIPASVSSIEAQAFTTCTSLREYTVASDSPYFMTQDGVLYSKDGSVLNSYPAGKTQKSFSIPETVDVVNDWAFEGNGYLESIYVSENVSYQFCSFGHCAALQEIEVSENNANYSSKDGVFYTKDGTILLYYPAGKKETSFEVPEQVEELEFNAFLQNGYLKSVTIPEGISVLKAFLFKEAESLTELYLPSTITQIDAVAFWNAQTTPTIYTPSNSVTEDFCQANGFPCVVLDS